MIQTIFGMPNYHGEDSGTPPSLIGTLGAPYIYHGYFENCDGDQWIFTYDHESKKALLRGGDVGWGTALQVESGGVVDLVLRKTERDWLSSCWKEATEMDYSQKEEVN